jgi:hypothetical protein
MRPLRPLRAAFAAPKTGRSFSRPGHVRLRPVADIRSGTAPQSSKVLAVETLDVFQVRQEPLGFRGRKVMLSEPANHFSLVCHVALALPDVPLHHG